MGHLLPSVFLHVACCIPWLVRGLLYTSTLAVVKSFVMSAATPPSLVDLDVDTIAHALEPIAVPSASPRAWFSNWADTFHCRPERIFEPTTIEECRYIVELARRRGARLHPVGVGHSPSDLACTNGWLVRMGALKGLIKLDHDKRSASFYAGTILHDIHHELDSAQPPMAMPNIGSISDQTIGGLISTASHGSGVTFPVLSQHVRAITLILPLPGAPLVRCTATNDPDLFKASLCGLGATGLMVEVEIEVEEAFRLRETKEPRPVDEVLGQLDELKHSAEHVRLWWYPDAEGVIIGRANRTYQVGRACRIARMLMFQAAQPSSSLLAHILGFHVTQFFLFVSRFITSLTPWVGRWAWWLSNVNSVNVDHGYKVLNFDCLVCVLDLCASPAEHYSSLSMRWNGPCHRNAPKLVFV